MIETEGKQIASGKILIKDLFNDDMWYKIPEYQRPYVWGVDQIDNLLDDISYAAVNTKDSQYFLGSLVLNTQSVAENGVTYKENSVLDGQQRLTTLYLLHAVIRDLETTSESRRKSIESCIYQKGNPDDGIPERARIVFEVRNEVEEFINTYIKTVTGTQKKEELIKIAQTSDNISIKNMANAILIIQEWLATSEIDVDIIYPYLRQNVLLIFVASAELEDAFRMFTVLNDRGIKLRNSDILKTLNLQKIENKETRLKYAKQWEDLEGDLSENFDQFLSYIRTILVKEKARLNLLKEFEENIYFEKGNKTNKLPLINKGEDTFYFIKRYKEHYDQIFSGNNYELCGNWEFDNLINIMEQTALSDIWIPPMLHFREKFGEYKILDFLKKIDIKYTGDWINRVSPTLRIEAMNSILKKIDELASMHREDTNSAVDELLNSDVFKVDTTEFFRQIEDGPIYKKRFTRNILRKLDFLLDAPYYSERRNSYQHMSVEHILPQNPADNSQWVNDFSQENRAEWTDKLGNLILLSRIKNTSQGRLDFKLKKEKYFKKNIETFPNSLNVMQNTEWKFDDLKKNHEQKIELLKKYMK
ncbi:DUF262 domain-containing HNH endonuclease family protein [Empedobacter falsenii]